MKGFIVPLLAVVLAVATLVAGSARNPATGAGQGCNRHH